MFLRDLRDQTTTLVSPPVPKPALVAAAAKAPAAGPKVAPKGVVAAHSAPLPLTSVVSIFDNAFFRSRDRPTVRLRLKRRGTYEFVCAIHAPGMRMSAVVQ